MNRFFSSKMIATAAGALIMLMAVMYLGEVPPFDNVVFSINPFDETDKMENTIPEENISTVFKILPNASEEEIVSSALEQLNLAQKTYGTSLKNADKLSVSQSYFSQTGKSYPTRWLIDNKSFAIVAKKSIDSLSSEVRIALYDEKAIPRSFVFVLNKKGITESWQINHVRYEP